MPKFNENFKTQYNEREEYQGIRTVITFEFENTNHVKKNVAITEKSVKLYMTNIISDVDFTHEPIVHFNVPVLEKTFIHY